MTTLDRDGRTVEEFDTLVDPQRDTGPVHIHGVTTYMVETAPTFAEIASAVAGRVHGAVLVAHNLAFDTRMLTQEFNRVSINFHPGNGICTQKLTRQKLKVACHALGIEYIDQHAALADARATAEVLQHVAPHWSGTPAKAGPFDTEAGHPPTLSRHTVQKRRTVHSERTW